MSRTKTNGKSKPAKGGWVDVTEEFMKDEKKETLDIPPPTCMVRFGNREYHAVGVRLDVLGMRNQPYVAMFVYEHAEGAGSGDSRRLVNKMAELDEAAYRFLVAEGLPITAAKPLTAMAAAIREEDAARPK